MNIDSKCPLEIEYRDDPRNPMHNYDQNPHRVATEPGALSPGLRIPLKADDRIERVEGFLATIKPGVSVVADEVRELLKPE